MKLSDNQLKNKIILVTGASRGIGKSASIMYASLGAKVILLGRDLESLEQVYDEIVQLKYSCLLYTSPSPRDQRGSRMPSSA